MHLNEAVHYFAFSPQSTVAAAGLSLPYDNALSLLLQTLVFLANVAGGLVVGVGTVRGIITYVVDLARSRGDNVPKEGIRLSLGRSLALALEFQLGADILATALNPSQKDVIVLASIVVLRTVLNFFLQRELAEAQRREAEANAARDGTGPTERVGPDTTREKVTRAPQTGIHA